MAFQLILPQVELRYKEIWVMDEEKEKQKEERRFSQEQYDMLLRCSEKKDMTEWNEWRVNNPNEAVLLQRADMRRAHLEGAKLQNAFLWEAKLEGANLRESNLQDAKLMRARLQSAEFGGAKLQGADFSRAIVDGGTLIWRCEVDRKTKFEGVGLNSARIYPETKQLLEYNIRRMNWEEWYKKNPRWAWLVKMFWLISDYGRSTKRVIATFFAMAFVFASIYYHWARIAPPGIVSNLLVDREGVAVQWWLVPLRTLYFSIVTQTTLGFGDMYAKGQSIFGHLLLMLQVLLGYVLLGALITRFAVLFTAGGPAGKFEEQKKKVDSVSPDNGIRGQASTE